MLQFDKKDIHLLFNVAVTKDISWLYFRVTRQSGLTVVQSLDGNLV